jgi:hypothetical protein
MTPIGVAASQLQGENDISRQSKLARKKIAFKDYYCLSNVVAE